MAGPVRIENPNDPAGAKPALELVNSDDAPAIKITHLGAGNANAIEVYRADGTLVGGVDQVGGVISSTTPTNSELTFETFYAVDIAATQSIAVAIAPFACTIEQASLMPWNANVTADDANYWTAELSRWRAGAQAVIASKTTQLTGGQGMSQRSDWNYDAVSFSATNKVFAKGDCIGIRFAKTGTPGNISGVVITVRYEPT